MVHNVPSEKDRTYRLFMSRKSALWFYRGAIALLLFLSLYALQPSSGKTVNRAHAQASQSGNVPIGLNVDINEQSRVDLFQNARIEAAGSTSLTEDSDGWPSSDFKFVLDNRYAFAWVSGAVNIDPLKRSTDLSGTYKLSFTGQAVLTETSDDPAHTATSIANQVYDPSTNTTMVDITYGNPAGGLLSTLQFSQTKRNPTDNPGTGLTNIHMIRPGYQPGTTQIFTNPWNHQIGDYPWSALRFMGALGTNDYAGYTTPEVYPYRLNWNTDRMLPGKGPLYGANHVGVHGSLSWEEVVLIAQQFHHDIWINVPVNASDDYVNQLANLLKNGDQYTNNQGIPNDVNVYVEYSNEMWHYGFYQGSWNNGAAQDEVKAGGSNLNYDNCNNNNDCWRFRRFAKRTIEIGNQLKSVFNDDGTRIRPVINNANLGAYYDMLQYVVDNYGPVNKVLYGISYPGYYTSQDKSSVAAILAGEQFSGNACPGDYQELRTIATYYGVHMLSYEAGQDEEGNKQPVSPVDTTLPNQFAAARDPGMAQVEEHNILQKWFPCGGELYMQFSQVGRYSTYGMWGLSEDINDTSTGKWNGIVQALQSPWPTVTGGIALPTTMNQTVSVPQSSNGQDVGVSPATTPGIELLLNVSQAGTYAFTMNGKENDNPVDRQRIMVDGKLQGYTYLPPWETGEGISTPVALSLTPGLHSLFIYPEVDSIGLAATGSYTFTLESPVVGDKINLALNGPATSSSNQDSSYPASNAFDGNSSTRWSSQFSDPQWLQVDLGYTYRINEVKLSWEAAYAKAYQIQVSNDGTTWNTIYSTTNGAGGTEDLTGLAGTGRYVRMYGTQRATPYGYSLWEMAVYGSYSGGNANLTLNQFTTASSVQDVQYAPANAVDGNLSTRWSSQFSDPQWLQVDFGQVCTVNEVKLSWEAAYATSFQIQLSNDGTNWSTIYNTTTGTGGVQDLTGLSGSGRYIRMYGTQRATPYGYSLWEFEVYGHLG